MTEYIEVVSDGFNFVFEKVEKTFCDVDQRKSVGRGDGVFFPTQVATHTEQLFT